jgi:hypothetical protein
MAYIGLWGSKLHGFYLMNVISNDHSRTWEHCHAPDRAIYESYESYESSDYRHAWMERIDQNIRLALSNDEALEGDNGNFPLEVRSSLTPGDGLPRSVGIRQFASFKKWDSIKTLGSHFISRAAENATRSGRLLTLAVFGASIVPVSAESYGSDSSHPESASALTFMKAFWYPAFLLPMTYCIRKYAIYKGEEAIFYASQMAVGCGIYAEVICNPTATFLEVVTYEKSFSTNL